MKTHAVMRMMGFSTAAQTKARRGQTTLIAVAWASIAWSGCATSTTSDSAPRPPRPISVACGSSPAVHITIGGAPADVAEVAGAVPGACQRLAAAELSLLRSTPIRVHDDVDSFVAATGQVVETLRAWSSVDGVELLTPESWYARDPGAVERRVAHELCHVAIFQRSRLRPPPRALAEGICSVVAGQDDERLTLDEVKRGVAQDAPIDFVNDSRFAYGVAHHVIAGFVRCRGLVAVRAAIEAIADGADVDVALGAPPLSFLDGCPAPPTLATP